VVVRRQSVVFVMIQAVAISGHARHEDVADQAIPAGASRAFHLRGRSAALPIVNIVEDHVKAAAIDGFANLLRVVSIAHQAFDALAEIVLRRSVKDGDGVSLLQQFGDKPLADEKRPANDQHAERRDRG